jgi:hypothetical protein
MMGEAQVCCRIYRVSLVPRLDTESAPCRQSFEALMIGERQSQVVRMLERIADVRLSECDLQMFVKALHRVSAVANLYEHFIVLRHCECGNQAHTKTG